MVVSTDDVRDLHVCVVHYHDVVVDGHAGRTYQHKIRDDFVRELDLAANDIVEADGTLGDTQPDGGRSSGGTAGGSLRGANRATGVGHRRRARLCTIARTLFFSIFVCIFRAKAWIGLSLFNQPLGVLLIQLHAIGLTIGGVRASLVRSFVPIEPKPAKVLVDLLFKARFTALDVCIFDAQYHDPIFLAGNKPVKQRCAGVAYVQLTCGRRSKTDANLPVLGSSIGILGHLSDGSKDPDLDCRRLHSSRKYVRVMRSCHPMLSSSKRTQR